MKVESRFPIGELKGQINVKFTWKDVFKPKVAHMRISLIYARLLRVCELFSVVYARVGSFVARYR